MKSNNEIKELFLKLAQNDERIRAVLLQGSRVNKKIVPDNLQDFDILLIVDQPETFISDHQWISVFGEKIIWQLPDEMDLGNNRHAENHYFHYLMLFKEGHRIDLALFPKNKIESHFKTESLTELWLDKDGLFPVMEMASDTDYHIRKPDQKLFAEVCNEFWWVSTYISKALIRNEIPHAKAVMEGPVRKMFMQLTAWYIGVENEFSVAFGKDGRFMNKYLDEDIYSAILKTYPDHQSENIWKSLFLLTELFSKFARHISQKMNFQYNLQVQKNTMAYLHQQFSERK